MIQGDYLHAKINNLQEIELANFRPILPQAFDHLQRYVHFLCKNFVHFKMFLLVWYLVLFNVIILRANDSKKNRYLKSMTKKVSRI